MDSMQDNVGDSSNVAQSVVSIMGNAPVQRRGRGSLAMKDPKKAYEEFQTSRLIRQYLEKLSGKLYNEKELMEMSYNCEPPVSSMWKNLKAFLVFLIVILIGWWPLVLDSPGVLALDLKKKVGKLDKNPGISICFYYDYPVSLKYLFEAQVFSDLNVEETHIYATLRMIKLSVVIFW